MASQSSIPPANLVSQPTARQPADHGSDGMNSKSQRDNFGKDTFSGSKRDDRNLGKNNKVPVSETAKNTRQSAFDTSMANAGRTRADGRSSASPPVTATNNDAETENRYVLPQGAVLIAHISIAENQLAQPVAQPAQTQQLERIKALVSKVENEINSALKLSLSTGKGSDFLLSLKIGGALPGLRAIEITGSTSAMIVTLVSDATMSANALAQAGQNLAQSLALKFPKRDIKILGLEISQAESEEKSVSPLQEVSNLFRRPLQ